MNRKLSVTLKLSLIIMLLLASWMLTNSITGSLDGVTIKTCSIITVENSTGMYQSECHFGDIPIEELKMETMVLWEDFKTCKSSGTATIVGCGSDSQNVQNRNNQQLKPLKDNSNGLDQNESLSCGSGDVDKIVENQQNRSGVDTRTAKEDSVLSTPSADSLNLKTTEDKDVI